MMPRRSLAALLSLLLLSLSLAASIAHAAPSTPTRLERRAVIRGADNTSVPINLSARYAVRWMDPATGTFGATLNLTFAPNPELFAMRWQVRFRLADNGTTQVREYWGSWRCNELSRGWYQILPQEDLRLNNESKVFFSFNGVWNSSRGDWNTTKMAATALEVQVAEPGSSRMMPVVYQLRDAAEFANEPVPFEVPSAPFGNFVRSPARPGTPIARMLGSLPTQPPPMPTSNFTGLYIVVPILAAAVLAFCVASLQSWKWRRLYRLQLEQVARMPPAALEKQAEPVTYDNAYAGYYMMLDGAWDHQAVHDGEEVVEARPYSYAPVVTEAASSLPNRATQTPEQQQHRRRTTLLIPGKEYRMTLLERGVPMPTEWLPPALQQQYAGASKISSPAPMRPPPPVPSLPPPPAHTPPSHPPPPLPLHASLTDPFQLPPIQVEADSPAVQSRGLASNRLRKEVVAPEVQVAESVPAAPTGAVVIPAGSNFSLAPGLVPALPIPSALISPLSPGWPLVADEDDAGSAYSPPEASELSQRRPSDDQVLAVSLGSSTGSSKPLPAVKGWNMI